MKEQFDSIAIRLANLALQKSRPGRSKEMRKLSKELLKFCEPIELKTHKKPERNSSKPIGSPIDVHIRWMIRRDMTEVLDIENQHAEPWPEDVFYEALRQRNYIGMVCEYDSRVVGFMVYSLHINKMIVESLRVHQDFRDRTVGSQMINKLKLKLCEQRRHQLLIKATDDNLPMHKFLQKHGFRCVKAFDDEYGFRYSVKQTT